MATSPRTGSEQANEPGAGDGARSDSCSYVVAGMTCAHCVASVRDEVSELPGVEVLDVDLESGRLVVGGSAAGDRGAVEAAVEEAGYSLEPA
ncbi:MAG TPA: heavy metal-associated domain-containing protein [Conexibacter sp.]|jgi:copper chaperone CopZ